MIVQSWVASCSAAFLLFIGYTANTSATDASIDPAKAQITVLYDAFGQASAMQKDWGYAAFIEYGGKRILFDTGNNPDILAQNAKAKDVDLSKLDFVVMSHRHGDHMGGLAYLLKVNPKVTIYALEGEPQSDDLRPEGRFRRLWRGFAKRLLSQRPVSPTGATLLQRCTTRSHAVWLGLAWR